MAIISLVMGILALIICYCNWITIVSGVFEIIFVIMSKGKNGLSAQTKAGLILSIVGVVINITMLILVIVMQMIGLVLELLLQFLECCFSLSNLDSRIGKGSDKV